MRPLNIDFVPRRRPAPWMWRAVASLGALAVGLLGMAVYEKAQTDRIEAEIERCRAEPVAPILAASSVAMPAYDRSARQMMAERLAAWPAALRALEVTQAPGVQVVGVDISATEQRIRVDVLYEDLGNLLGYVADLNQGESTQRWKLDRANTSERQGSPSSASLSATLAP